MATRLLLCLAIALGSGYARAWAGEDPHGAAANGQHAADAHGAGEINPIPMSWQDVQGDLALWTGAVFLVLVAILWRFAWRPLAEGLDKRERHVADQINRANEANQQAQQLLADYQRQLAEAGEKVRAMLDQGRRDAEQLARQMLDQAKQQAQAEQRRAVEQIDAASAAAIKDLADRGAALAVELAGKIVRANLKPADHARLIEESVKEMMNAE